MKKKLWLAISGLCLMLGLVVLVVCLQTAKTKAEAAAENAVSADITVVKYRSVAGIMQYRRWNETKGAWVDEDWVDFTETPKPEQTAALTGTPAPTPTPKIYVTPAGNPVFGQQNNESEKPVEITAKIFGNPFYRYLKEKFDTDGDGMLSLKEREAVTEIDYVSENYVTETALKMAEKGVEGLNSLVNISVYFPNVEKIRVDFAREIRVSGLPKLKYFELRAEEENGKRNPYFSSEGVRRIRISQCPVLTEINCRNYLDGVLEVYECENLTTYTEEEGCTAKLFFETGMPKLSAYMMERADGTRQKTDISHGEMVRVVRKFGGQDGFEMVDVNALLTPAPTKAPVVLPTQMPEQKVVQADASTDKVLVDAAHFSDGVFRAYLLKTYDADKDGYLSKAEREQLTELRYYGSDTGKPFTKYAWALWGVQTFDGLDWFPNLDSISILESDATVFLKNHPSIRHVGNAEGGMSIWAENCETLESIGFGGESYGGTVFVKDCKNFKSFSVNDSDFLALYFSGTPNLVLTGNFLYDTSANVSLDTSVTLVFTDRSGCRIDENGKPFFDETNITWLGEGQFSEDLEKDFDRMRAMHEEAVRQAKVEEISVDKRRMDLYFSHIGRERQGTPGASNRASFYPDDVPKYAAENFSLEKRFETEGAIRSVWYSTGRTSIFTCATRMDVYYTDNEKKEKIEGCSVGAVHYFVREPDGTLTMYESSREAFEAIGLADAYQYYFSHKYLLDV